jgi:hypothetical protein
MYFGRFSQVAASHKSLAPRVIQSVDPRFEGHVYMGFFLNMMMVKVGSRNFAFQIKKLGQQ